MMDSLTNSVEKLYTLYHKDIVRFFAEHLADREAPWDLCHEVFVRLLLALASGTQLTHPQRWLMRVAKNLLIDTYRHQQTAAVATLPLYSHEVAMLASDATTFRTLLERKDMLHIIDAHTHKHHWTPEAFGDLHYGTDLRKLQKHLNTLQMKTLLVEDAGVSHSGSFIGNDATFSNFLLLGQVSARGRTTRTGVRRRYWKDA